MKPTRGARQSWEQNLLWSLGFFPSFHRTGAGMASRMHQGQEGDFGNNSKWVSMHSSKTSSFCFRWGVGSLSAGAEGDFCSQNSLVCFAASHERLSLNTTGRVPGEGWWHPSSALSDSTADLYFRFWKELFAILLSLTFPLAELATVTRPSDVFSTGKALKQSKMLCLVQSFLSGETSLTQGGFQEVCSPNCACERRVYCFFDCFNIYRRFLFKNICFSFQYMLCPQILLWRNPILWSGLLCSDPGRNVRCLNDILWVYFFGY